MAFILSCQFLLSHISFIKYCTCCPHGHAVISSRLDAGASLEFRLKGPTEPHPSLHQQASWPCTQHNKARPRKGALPDAEARSSPPVDPPSTRAHTSQTSQSRHDPNGSRYRPGRSAKPCPYDETSVFGWVTTRTGSAGAAALSRQDLLESR